MSSAATIRRSFPPVPPESFVAPTPKSAPIKVRWAFNEITAQPGTLVQTCSERKAVTGPVETAWVNPEFLWLPRMELQDHVSTDGRGSPAQRGLDSPHCES